MGKHIMEVVVSVAAGFKHVGMLVSKILVFCVF